MRSRDWSSDVCSSDLAGDRAVDQLRIERRQRVVTKAETIHHARPVVLDDAVAFRRQIAREHDAGFALETDDDSSEERPVGKEELSSCRPRWSRSHQHKKRYKQTPRKKRQERGG